MTNDPDTTIKIAKQEELLRRVYKLINEGQGNHYIEVDGEEATAIYNEIKLMNLDT